MQDAVEDLGRYIIDGIQRRVTRSISYRLAQDAAALKDLSSKIVPAAIQKPICTFKRFERSTKTMYETCPAQVPCRFGRLREQLRQEDKRLFSRVNEALFQGSWDDN